jgi:toluene monooxygenase system ferredoxin subunit
MWQKVCELSALSDKGLIETRIGEIPVLVINGSDCRLVVPRSCPHMAASLAEGVFDGHVLTCTKHLWQWSIDDGGSPLGEAESPLLCYDTKEMDGALYCRASAELKYEHEDE